LTIYDEIWNNITEIIQIITVIALIIALIWQFRDRRIKGAKLLIPEARIATIKRLENNTVRDNLSEKEALNLRGIFQINYFIMNVGDRNAFFRIKTVYVNSSGTRYKLNERGNRDFDVVINTKSPSSFTFAIPKNVWFTKKGDLIIKAEYVDLNELYKPLSFKIPLTPTLRDDQIEEI